MSNRLLNKILSLILSFAFIFTSSITPAVASSAPETNSSQVESVLVKQLTPPAELGSVVDAHVVNAKSPVVIQIQDLHANYGVQTNIVKLLEFLDSRLGAGKYRVAVEGAQGPVAITELAKITDRPFKTKVYDRLMKEAELTGTEYFSIVNGRPDLLVGVEDQHYHDANVALFQSTYKGKQQLAKALERLQSDLLPMKDKFYTHAMRKLDKKAADYAAGKIDMADYTTALIGQASKQGIDIASRYPEIAKWTGYAQTEKYPDFDKLMTEQADLFKEVQAGLSKTDLQRNAVLASSELDVLHRLLTEEVTTEEVRHLAPQLAEVMGHMKSLLDDSGLPYDKANLAEVASASLDFYAVALLRDKFLAENTLKLIQNPQSKIQNVVLVTGGFHTPGITKILKEKGVSYITISPTVASHTEKDQKLYVARLMGRHASPEDILAGNNMLFTARNSPQVEGVVAQTTWLAAIKEFGLSGTRTLFAPVGRGLSRLAQSFKLPSANQQLAPVKAVTTFKVGGRNELGDYTGSGNTSIHKALDDTKKLIDGKEYDRAGSLLAELIPDLTRAQDTTDIAKLMKRWNAKYPTNSEVDLIIDDLPAAISDAMNLQYIVSTHSTEVRTSPNSLDTTASVRDEDGGEPTITPAAGVSPTSNVHVIGFGNTAVGNALRWADYSIQSNKLQAAGAILTELLTALEAAQASKTLEPVEKWAATNKNFVADDDGKFLLAHVPAAIFLAKAMQAKLNAGQQKPVDEAAVQETVAEASQIAAAEGGPVNIGINGFGRIGRMTLRSILENHPELNVVAINDLMDVKALAHLLKYDTIAGHFPGTVEVDGNALIVNGERIEILAQKDPSKLPWGDLGVGIVIDSTGLFTDASKAKLHLQGGAKYVIISAPATNEDKTIVMGINEREFDPSAHHVLSNASCTTNCLAPVVQVLEQNFGIESGLMDTIHSFTNDQVVQDGPHKDLRRARGASANMIPTTTGAAKAISLVLPGLKGKLNGFAMRVPLNNVSAVDLKVILKKPATVEEINAAFKQAAASPEFAGILGYTEEPLVSSDFKGNTHSSIVDAALTMVQGRLAQVVAWYDNEWGYSTRLGDLVSYVAAKAGLSRRERLHQIALQMAPPTGGVLAADESDATAGKRLATVDLENTPKNQQRMRQMMLTTPNLRESGISAVILYESTLGNVDGVGLNLVQEHLVKRGILPGLKTDSGLIDDPESAGEKLPKPGSIDKLPKLLDKAKANGAVFTKWRTTIRAKNPTEDNIRKNAIVQAQQARITQNAGLVPMVEPEVVFDGSDGNVADHSVADSYASTTRTLVITFQELNKAGVWLDGMILKTSMILAGKKAPTQTDPDTVGFETLKGLLKTVPAEVPAIVFLSGGQGDNQATENLDAVIRASQTRFVEARDAAVNELEAEGNGTRAQEVRSLTKAPWEISYSFGRGLQARALAAWGGKYEQVRQGQQAMQANASEIQSARQGQLKAYRATLIRRAKLHVIALKMAPPTGGVLAADESEATAGKRLTSVGLDNTSENRERMRQMMLTPPGLKDAGVSAVILYKETLGNTDGREHNLVQEHLINRGILPGLKTDSGLIDDPRHPGEKLPKIDSLEKLPALLRQAIAAGAVFTKWRTTIRAQNPSEENIRDNAVVQAKQAKTTQDAGLVPMVEPEVVFDGSDGSAGDHDLATSYAATTKTLEITFEELNKAGVWLDGMILKTSMILAGKKASKQTDPDTVGFETLKGLLKTVPAEVPAIVFLSGGQGDNQATENLDAVIRASQNHFIQARDAAVQELRREGKKIRAAEVASLIKAPWEISYSFGRGLQARALAAWGGKDTQFVEGQVEMLATAREVSSARQGKLKSYRKLLALRAKYPTPLVPLHQGVQIASPDIERTLSRYGLTVSHVAAYPLNGTDDHEVQNLFSEEQVGGIVATSIAGALGSIGFAGGGKAIKEEADGNAVYMADQSLIAYVLNHPNEAVVIMGDEGSRDNSFSLKLGRVYFHKFADGRKEHEGADGRLDLGALKTDLQLLQEKGITIRYFVGDALEVTNGLADPKAGEDSKIPTNSWALVALFDQRNELVHDEFRFGGITYSANQDAGVEPFDLPSVALPKIAAANGAPERTRAFEHFMNHTRIIMLGPRSSAAKKEGDKEVHRHQTMIRDAQELQQRYPGMQVITPGDGDAMPRVIAGLGLVLDGYQTVVFGRSGAAEATSSLIPVVNNPRGFFTHTHVSEKGTKDVYSMDNAYNYAPNELARFARLGIPDVAYLHARDKSRIKGHGLLAMTAVTGASAEIFGPAFASKMRRIEFIPDDNGIGGMIVLNTLLVTRDGKAYTVQTTLASDDLAASRQKLKNASGHASTPGIALGFGFLFVAAAVAVGAFVSPGALLLLVPAFLEFRETYEGVRRNLSKQLSFRQALTSPAAVETENVAELQQRHPALGLHEFSHQLTGAGEVLNFYLKYVTAIAGLISQFVLWVSRLGNQARLNPEQSRVALGLEQLAAVSPIRLVNTVSAAAAKAFENSAYAQQRLIEQRRQLAANEEQRESA